MRGWFPWFFTLTTLVALVLAAVWYMSPLALGFSALGAQETAVPLGRLYEVTYYAGIPLLLAGQAFSFVLARLGHYGIAYTVPLAAIATFLAGVATVLALLS